MPVLQAAVSNFTSQTDGVTSASKLLYLMKRDYFESTVATTLVHLNKMLQTLKTTIPITPRSEL